jgi:hypothetical protein
MHLTINAVMGIISFLVAIEMAIGHGTVQLTNAIPEKAIPTVQAWCNILAFIGTSMTAALSTGMFG